MNELNANNNQLITHLIELMPKDVHQLGRQLMSDEIIGEPVVHLRQTLEDYVMNDVILKWQSTQATHMKTIVSAIDDRDVYDEMCVKCETILDKMWETINCCDWSRVLIDFRHCFAFISLFKSLITIWSTIGSNDVNHCLQQRLIALKSLDFGLLMSPKLSDNNILAKFATIIHKSVMDCKQIADNCHQVFDDNNSSDCNQCSLKRKSHENELKSCKHKDMKTSISDQIDGNECDYQSIVPYFKNSINNRIKREECLDLEAFNDIYLKTKTPVIITNCMTDWPAMSGHKWTVDYIESVAAYRTVPIEIGSKYTDEEWSQKLMTIKEFINEYVVNSRCERVGYLAQHNLFDQIEELSADFSVPDYCSLTDEDCVDVDINSWFGPKGTVSPLHFDPKDNLLAQVLGEKYVRLYSSDTEREVIYPNDCRLLFNTSQVDVENVDPIKYPNFKANDNYFECILKEGEMLYIPKNWWHFVKSLSTSVSISFWWK